MKEIAMALSLLFLMSLGASRAEASPLKVGVAVRVVTPDPLLPVSGGTGTSKPTTQKIGDLTVRALVIEKDKTRLAIVGADFLGFPGVLCKRVRALVKDIPPENIMIGATHTHSAPDMYGFVNEKHECFADLDYIDSVCTKMADAINEAAASTQKVVVKIATADAKGKIAYNYYAPELYDPRMSVIQFLKAKHPDEAVATLVNYATHPEIIGSGQGILSPDLAGPLYDRIAEKGGGTAIFMNSAQGGMVTADCRGPDGDVQTWDECVRIGNLMADEALRIVTRAEIQEDPELFCGATTLTFPVDSGIMKFILRSSPLNFGDKDVQEVSTQVNVVNLGNAQILTIPGEALPNIGFYLKRKMYGKNNLLFGLTNDAFGYMLDKVDFRSFDRYDYISGTSLGEMTGEIFMEEALKFVDACPRPQK